MLYVMYACSGNHSSMVQEKAADRSEDGGHTAQETAGDHQGRKAGQWR